jgi:putative nucleotidyltransferase with HDIG domain
MSAIATSVGDKSRKREAKKPRAHEVRFGTGGLKLADAFDVVSDLPVLAEARRRLFDAAAAPIASSNELIDAIESDSGLTIAVMRAANNGGGPVGRCEGVREAVEALTFEGVKTIAASLTTYDVFEAPGAATQRSERFRRHAISVRDAAERIADQVRIENRDQLAAAALLHDVGRLVLAELYRGFDATEDPLATPGDRLRHERRELGIDHTLVGAVLTRRWGLPATVAAAIERHHAPDANGPAAVIKLADLIAHHSAGGVIPPGAMLEAADALELDRVRLRSLVYEFPHSATGKRRSSEPCPLSLREIDALRGLAEGKVYKQIAQELSLSVSTIRTHLHNVYRKIGAVDRAQAVLIARDRGWI